jgi:hypothetical protein
LNFTFTFMYWRGRRFELLSLIADMVFVFAPCALRRVTQSAYQLMHSILY